MTRVTFYVLADTGADAQLRFACRLSEKAHTQGHRLYLHVDHPDTVTQLDALLWTFRQGSFVPHATVQTLTGTDDPTPVVIGNGEPPAHCDDMLINLGVDVPICFSRFTRTLEIVTPATRQAARNRFRFYKDRGYELETHTIG